MWMEIKEILNSNDAKDNVVIRGWVKTFRNLKKIYFMEVNDGSCFSNIQIVIDSDIENIDDVKNITTGSSVEVLGKLVESPAKGQKWEVQTKEVNIYSIADSETYPLQKKRHSFEFLRTIAHLKTRTNTFGAVNRVRSSLIYAIHKFFNDKGFNNIHTPIVTGSDAEGAGQMFQVTTLDLDKLKDIKGPVDYGRDFFGKKTSLTVSGQLEAEIFALALGKVYTFGPTFRAENSNTPRHLSEFWMIEPEMAFYKLEDDIRLAEEFVKYIIKYVLEKNKEDMEFFNKWIDKGIIDKLEKIISEDFEKCEYTKAIEILEKADKKFEYEVSWGIDLQTEHERYLTEEYFKKPVFIINYPRDIKAFYMRLNDDGKTVGATDLLVPGIGEIIGGSEREDRYDVLLESIKRFGLDPEEYWWYLDLRKYGSVPHSGFGLGFERLVQFVTGMKNIRDVIPLFRAPKSAEF